MTSFPNDPSTDGASPEDRFDDALRHQMADFEAEPAPAAWATLRAQLPAPRPAAPPWRARLGTFAGGVVVGALLWWGGGQSEVLPPAVSRAENQYSATETPNTPLGERNTTLSAPNTPLQGRNTPLWRRNTPFRDRNTAFLSRNTENEGAHPALLGASGGRIDSGRHTAGALSGHIPSVANVETRDSLIRQAARAYLAPLTQVADTGQATRLRALLAEQTRALAFLTARLDSVKQALPETPPTLAATPSPDSVAPAPATWPTLPPVRSPWALLLTTETTPSWSILPTRSPVTPTQEQTLASFGQSAQLQYQAAPRWRVRAGVGQATVQTQLRTIAERTGERILIDSTLTTDVDDYQTTSEVIIVRHDTIFIYEPRLNDNAQVIGYDTSFVVSTDTTRTIVTTTVHDTVHRTHVTQRTETLRERQQQQFRPTYRFWTLPLAVNYTLLTSPRWRLGGTVGGQVSVFRGGTRPALIAGDHYELRRVGPRDGPYRPVSFSLSAGLEAEYRLSPRLSATVAPTVRWGAVPAARGGQRTLLPAAQVGLSYGF